MAHVSAAKFYDRSRLPHAAGGEPTKTYSSPRRTKSEFPRHNVFRKDVSETLQHAALINIVAAVNEDSHGTTVTRTGVTAPGSAIDSLKNTVAVISNLMTPRHRSVSIPKPQHGAVSLSDDMVQKKPMYYRQAEEDNKAHRACGKHADSSKGREKTQVNTNVELLSPSPVQSVKIMPVKSKYNDADFKIIEKNLKDANDNLVKAYDKPKDFRMSSSSSVRLLGSFKKNKARKVHTVAKCDAVDLMDTSAVMFAEKHGNAQDPAKAFLDDSRKIIPHSTMEPYNRPTSLPGAFPAKAKKFNRASSTPPGKQHIYKNKNPIASMVSKDTPQSMYRRMMSLPGGFGYESLSIGNGVNQEPDIFSPLSHDSARVHTARVSFASLVSSRNSRRLGTPRTPMTYSGESTWSFGTGLHEQHAEMEIESVSNLHEAIESAMGRNSEDIFVEDKENEDIVYTPTDGEKISKGNVGSPRKTPRKVQFDSREISMSSDESIPNDGPRPFINGGSSIIQMPTSVFRSYSPAIQPMSAHELLRFKQRFFPANMPQHHAAHPSYFSASSVLKINQMRNRNASVSPSPDLRNLDSRAEETEAESDAIIEVFLEDGGTLVTHQENTQKQKTPSAVNCKSKHNAPQPETVHAREDREEKHDFYKLIKAIDTRSYTGFEHKKLRKHADPTSVRSVDKQKDHYVKVKVS